MKVALVYRASNQECVVRFGSEEIRLKCPHPPRYDEPTAAWDSCGQFLAVLSSGQVRIFNTSNCTATLLAAGGQIQSACWNGDRRELLLRQDDRILYYAVKTNLPNSRPVTELLDEGGGIESQHGLLASTPEWGERRNKTDIQVYRNAYLASNPLWSFPYCDDTGPIVWSPDDLWLAWYDFVGWKLASLESGIVYHLLKGRSEGWRTAPWTESRLTFSENGRYLLVHLDALQVPTGRLYCFDTQSPGKCVKLNTSIPKDAYVDWSACEEAVIIYSESRRERSGNRHRINPSDMRKVRKGCPGPDGLFIPKYRQTEKGRRGLDYSTELNVIPIDASRDSSASGSRMAFDGCKLRVAIEVNRRRRQIAEISLTDLSIRKRDMRNCPLDMPTVKGPVSYQLCGSGPATLAIWTI